MSLLSSSHHHAIQRGPWRTNRRRGVAWNLPLCSSNAGPVCLRGGLTYLAPRTARGGRGIASYAMAKARHSVRQIRRTISGVQDFSSHASLSPVTHARRFCHLPHKISPLGRLYASQEQSGDFMRHIPVEYPLRRGQTVTSQGRENPERDSPWLAMVGRRPPS